METNRDAFDAIIRESSEYLDDQLGGRRNDGREARPLYRNTEYTMQIHWHKPANVIRYVSVLMNMASF